MSTPPKPLAVHKLHGTYREDRHGKQSPATKTAGYLPVKPANLDEVAGRLWDFIAQERASWLAQSDGPAMRLLCEVWSLRCQVLEKLMAAPTDKDVRCSYIAYHTECVKLFAKFGLSPSDRARLGEVVEDHDSILDEFLR